MNKTIYLILFSLLIIPFYESFAEEFIVTRYIDGRITEFIPEYSGKLILDRKKIFYTTEHPKKSFQVGEIDSSGKLILCKEKFQSICEIIYGVKWPEKNESVNLEHDAIHTVNIIIKSKPNYVLKRENDEEDPNIKTKFSSLNEYLLSSPNQEDAGSCLYMATTGAMEILLNKKLPPEERKHDGISDLSERFLMNVDTPIENWRTDTILSYNYVGGALLNRDYRYTKGWYKDVDNVLTKVDADTSGAEYGPYFNWIDEYNGNNDLQDKLVDVPYVKRDIIFKEVNNEVWNTSVMNYADVENIKKALLKKRSPVLVIYNHFAYWHAVLIVGFDDEKDNGGCPFVTRWRPFMREKAEKLLQSEDPAEKARGERYMRYVTQVDARFEKYGCRSKGVFYIRDSIYQGEPDDIYDYDLSAVGDETPYAKKIVEKSYDWMFYLGNHSYVIY